RAGTHAAHLADAAVDAAGPGPVAADVDLRHLTAGRLHRRHVEVEGGVILGDDLPDLRHGRARAGERRDGAGAVAEPTGDGVAAEVQEQARRGAGAAAQRRDVARRPADAGTRAGAVVRDDGRVVDGRRADDVVAVGVRDDCPVGAYRDARYA